MSDERPGRLIPCEVEILTRHPAWRLGNVLDVRSVADFGAGHLVPAVSLPLPASLLVRGGKEGEALLAQTLPSIFLPPKHEPLLVMAGEAAVAETVCDHLQERGRTAVDPVAVNAERLVAWPPELLQRGPCRRRLWRPPAYLADHAAHLPPPVAGPVLDLGAGNCRAAVWLAARGYRVTAVDRHAEALAQGRRLAESCDVCCDFLQRDLSDPRQMPPGPWAMVLAFRYLQRPLLQRLPEYLRPHGLVMVRTFRHVEGVSDLPSERHRLQSGELLRLFPSDRYFILVHEEDTDPDGRPAAGIVARLKPLPGLAPG